MKPTELNCSLSLRHINCHHFSLSTAAHPPSQTFRCRDAAPCQALDFWKWLTPCLTEPGVLLLVILADLLHHTLVFVSVWTAMSYSSWHFQRLRCCCWVWCASLGHATVAQETDLCLVSSITKHLQSANGANFITKSMQQWTFHVPNHQQVIISASLQAFCGVAIFILVILVFV